MMHFHQVPARAVAEPDEHESFVEMSQTLVARSLFLTVESCLPVSLLAFLWFSRRSLRPYHPDQGFLLGTARVKFSKAGDAVKVGRKIFGCEIPKPH